MKKRKTYWGQKNAPTKRNLLMNAPLITCFSISRNEWFGSSSEFTSKPKPTVPTTSIAYLRREAKWKKKRKKKNNFNRQQWLKIVIIKKSNEIVFNAHQLLFIFLHLVIIRHFFWIECLVLLLKGALFNHIDTFESHQIAFDSNYNRNALKLPDRKIFDINNAIVVSKCSEFLIEIVSDLNDGRHHGLQFTRCKGLRQFGT